MKTSSAREPQSNETSAADLLAAAQADVARLTLQNSHLRATIAMHLHLLANVAHEIRTPLSAIRGYTRMVSDGRAGEVTARQKEFLNTVTENTNRLIHHVNWMTRIGDPTQQELNLSEVEGRLLWSECRFAHEAALSGKAISIKETFSEESFPILGDRARLDRLLRQILDTAIECSNSGTQLSMSMSRPREGGISIRLSGIDGAIAEGAGESDAVGAMQDIVGLHGGRLFVRPTADEGTVILFTLPEVRSAGHGEWTGNRSV